MHRHRRTAARLAALMLALALPATALAEVKANRTQARKISRAVYHSSQTNGVPDRDYTVTKIYISTKRRTWAKASIEPRAGFGGQVQPATAVLRFRRGHWRVFEVGGAGLGCGVPASVNSDLRLGGCGY